MARPLINTKELRERVDCYLNPAEVEIISSKAKSAGLPLSTFLRRSALDRKISSVPTGNIQHWQELAHLSSNLNQIARHLNEGFAFDVSPALIEKLLEQVKALRLDLMQGDDSEAG